MNASLVHKIQQALPRLALGPQRRPHRRGPQHIHRPLQLAVHLVHLLHQLHKVLLAPFARCLQALAHAPQNHHLVGNGVAQKARLGGQHDRVLVGLPRRPYNLIGAQDERHGRQRPLGHQQMVDERVDGDGQPVVGRPQ